MASNVPAGNTQMVVPSDRRSENVSTCRPKCRNPMVIRICTAHGGR